ncbi:ferric iron reductase protein FhuF [Stella humosa]|uniref:Ferric iron reductase protein FhuF n=1 Tax=Stella humosa TaxID=94 RepID=A0A3N1KV15_9PROT|nr:hypothetical protein [Stella humosa]ROP83322.1 ferric iron reductase protein FhuF [Stella humosa]BBK29895.1 hypothetical protein STHU_05290 [Stella humosa]
MTSPDPFEPIAAVARPWLHMMPQDDGPRPDGEAVMPLSQVVASATLAEAIERHRRGRFGVDACARASASVWSKSLFSAVLPAQMLAALAGGAPDPDPPLLVVDGLPKATLALPPAGLDGPPALEALAAWTADTLGHLAIAALARQSGLATRLFWSNAATMMAFLCEKWDDVPAVAGRSVALRNALFACEPLRGQISYVPTPVPAYPTMRRRRLCCLRDRVGQRLCTGCPKIADDERDAVLAAVAAGLPLPAPTAPSKRPTG